MDFLTNLIKRPNSMALPAEQTSGNIDGTSTATTICPDITSSNILPSSQSSTCQPQISVALNRYSIDTELENLFDSAARDLDCLEQQHKQLIDSMDTPEVTPTSPRETIQQLLTEINVNLDQVTEYEMEHLQAMSLELSPLAVKASPKQSMEQQKVATALRSTSQLGTPTTAVCSHPFKLQDVEYPLPKFTGLPEFDETQIPDLAPLSAEMEAQLNADVSVPTPSSHVLKESEIDYNSDSEVYAECVSVNKFSAENSSSLEAYSSALNDVLEQASSLENTLNEADAAICSHNDSCEPMDVDEINETMEMLKDVLAPEDRQMLQQQFLGAMQKQKELGKQHEEEQQQIIQHANEGHKEIETGEKITQELLAKEENKNLEKLLVQKEDQKLEHLIINNEKDNQEEIEVQENKKQLELQHTKKLDTEEKQKALLPEFLPTTALKMPQADPVAFFPTSPPIPTHRMKTAEELKELLALQAYAEPQEMQVHFTKLDESQLNTNFSPQPLPNEEEEQSTLPKPVASVTATQHHAKETQIISLHLNVNDASEGCSAAPTSPAFPTKSSPQLAAHFPRSPHAPPEQEKISYLEEAVIEPSADRKLEQSGVISNSTVPVQVIVSKPSPEKPQEEQKLNETSPIDSESPVNSTINTSSEIIGAKTQSSRATFGVPLESTANYQRRTFTVLTNTEEDKNDLHCKTDPLIFQNQQSQILQHNPEKSNEDKSQETIGIDGLSFPIGANAVTLKTPMDGQYRTFSISNLEEQQEKHINSTQNMENSPIKRTFCQEQNVSPTLEATEENIISFEPMDVDVSMCEKATVVSSPLSAPIPTKQQNPLCEFDAQETEKEQESQYPTQLTHQQQRPTYQLPAQLNRPPIHCDATDGLLLSCPNATVVLEEQTLSVKEQLSASDEKDDVFVEHFGAISPISDDIFKAPQYSSSTFSNMVKGKLLASAAAVSSMVVDKEENFNDAEFQDGASNNNNISSSDFDFLYTKGSNNLPINRSSLLLKFDPLLSVPVPVNHSQQQLQQEQTLLNIPSNNNNQSRALSPTLEEHDTSGSNQSFVIEPSAKAAVEKDKLFKPPVDRTKKHAKMSVDVIDNDCNKTFDNSNLNLEDKTHKYNNMDDLEKKIKNEVTRSEDIEKKLKEAEQREEALVKRITEKDKTNSKLNGVIEAYEKAIAELIHDKEQLVQNHDRQMQEVQADRDANYHHLMSLETTFSDLHVKYEKSKEMTSHLKQVEDNLLDEKKKLNDKLRQQEQRYEQMKSHAMQQMEIANKKLATLTKEHSDEVKKLKALLKKEEVSRISTAEQLQQKSRENADLLKICEELIYDKGQGGSS